MRTARIVVSTAAALALGGALFARLPQADAADDPDFVRDVQPILAGRACAATRRHPPGRAPPRHPRGFPQGRDGRTRWWLAAPRTRARSTRASCTTTRSSACPGCRSPSSPPRSRPCSAGSRPGAPWPDGVTVAMTAPAGRRASPGARGGPRRAILLTSSSTATCGPILAANCYACHGPDRNNRQRPACASTARRPRRLALASGTVRDRGGRAGEERPPVRASLDPDETGACPTSRAARSG